MILAFKKSGWFLKKKVCIFANSLNSYESCFYELPALKKYDAGVILNYSEMRRLRDFINEELKFEENSTDE